MKRLASLSTDANSHGRPGKLLMKVRIVWTLVLAACFLVPIAQLWQASLEASKHYPVVNSLLPEYYLSESILVLGEFLLVRTVVLGIAALHAAVTRRPKFLPLFTPIASFVAMAVLVQTDSGNVPPGIFLDRLCQPVIMKELDAMGLGPRSP